MKETIALVAFVLFCGGVYFVGLSDGERLGRCYEKWTHTATASDTVMLVRSGCQLPDGSAK